MAFKFNEYHLGGKPAVIEPITIKENGTYNAPDGVDGYSPITVDVEGTGGKPPVLTELTVTENGVYDEPTANGEVVIAWDGNAEGHELGTIGMGEHSFPLVRVSDKALTAIDFTGAIVRVLGMSEPVELVDSLAPMQVSETMVLAVDGMIVSGSGSFSTEYANIELPLAGTYFLYMGEGEMYATEITLPNASTPADGWNKVTVNVAGDIVDVAELPTENIEEGKIYRVTNGDVVTYCIPNAHPVKRLVDGAWVELT